MKRLLLVLIPFLAIALAGCKPAGRAIASLQYHNIDFRLVRTTMSMTLGDGSLNLKPLMAKETYSGRVTSGRVTVNYPDGFEDVAHETAVRFDEFYPVVERETGIHWSFDVVLNLVRVPPGSTGFRYEVKIPKDRRIVFPIPVTSGPARALWTPIVAHELTEASLIAPRARSQVVLDDVYAGDFCLPFGTRWFRDGVSDYVESKFISPDYQPSGQVYSDLNRFRESLLKWGNCPHSPWMYDAAHGLISEMVSRFGPESLPRMMSALAKQPVPNGAGLARAFKQATGQDLREFLVTYQTPWTGMTVTDTARDSSRPFGVLADNRVVATGVYPRSPASLRGVEPGDVILSFAGEQVTSADQLANLVARQRMGDLVPVKLNRRGELLQMRLKMAPMPAATESPAGQ